MLRMIAGLEHPTEGRIFLDDDDITDRPAYTRDIGMVFQSLALFPHLNVAGNVGYGLRIRGAEKDRIASRVDELLDARLARGDGRSAHPAALRGAAPARGDRPRAGAGAPALPAGRAAVRARREPARAAPGGAPAAPAAARDHDDHRHARPAGGDDDVGSRRRDERGAHRTGRPPAGGLPGARVAVRRRVHRPHEPARGRGGRRRLGLGRRPPVRRRRRAPTSPAR